MYDSGTAGTQLRFDILEHYHYGQGAGYSSPLAWPGTHVVAGRAVLR
jgi:hypothetical protein